jgi:hypothetical protein
MQHSGFDPSLNFDSQTLVDLLQVWRDACGGREMPARSDLDPLTIGTVLLPYILLFDVEYQPKPRYRWRLIGTHFVTVLKRDSTGKYWDDLYSSDALAAMSSRADWVLQHRAPLRSTGHVTSKDTNRNIDAFTDVEGLYMPLSSDGETIDMIMMGAIYTSRQSPQDKSKSID